MAKKIPSFQFYPGDWLKDCDVRRCSLFARGLLVDLLCLMFESKRRGALSDPDGTPWPDDEILATISGASKDELTQGLRELERKHVLSRNEQGALYSRRIVRDEELRQKMAENGRKGGEANGQAKSKQTTKQNQSNLQEDEDEECIAFNTKEIVSRKTIPPPLAAVEAYRAEIGSDTDPQDFCDFYESKGWKVGSEKMKDWQASFRTWHRRESKQAKAKQKPTIPQLATSDDEN